MAKLIQLGSGEMGVKSILQYSEKFEYEVNLHGVVRGAVAKNDT